MMRLPLLLAAAALWAAQGCSKTASSAPAPAQAAPTSASTKAADPPAGTPARSGQPISVVTATVQAETVERRAEVTGTLAAWEEAVISIEAEGRLVSVRADLGDRVRKGEILAQIASQEYGYKKTQAEAELAAAKTDFDRVSGLSVKDMATRQDLDESRRRLDVARTAMDLAEKKLSDTTLRAPFDGKVAQRFVNLGEYVRLGTPAFQLVRISPLKFKGDVPEHYSADVKVGDPVEAFSESFPGRSLKGKVVRISPSISVDSRAFPIEAEIENPSEGVKPGTFAKLSILTGTAEQALTVPDTAVSEFAGNPRVFVVQDGKARERIITIAGRIRDRVIAATGLKPGETVIAAGLDLLTDGQPVTIRKD